MSSLPAPASSEQEQFKLTPAVQGIIAINLVVMFLQLTAVRYSYTSQWLGFDASRVPAQWWSVVTYSLVHTGVGHLLANLYGLYLFGPRLERSWSANGGNGGAKRFVWFYLLCALGGVAFDMLFIRQGVLAGSSAAVFGVMTAYVMQWPNDEVYFLFVLPMRAKALAVGLIAFNVLVGFAATGPGDGVNVIYFAHLGGIIAAYIYVRMSASTGIEQVRQRVANVPDADEPPRAIPRNLPRRERGDEVDDIVAKSKAIAAKRTVALTPSSRRREARADELNRVLDKISQQGIESLTTDERKLLEEMSKRLRGN
jgi:membrane associated rhomboid family serine protease